MYARLIIATLVVPFLASCATVGKNFSSAGLSHLRLQSTTESDVLDLFGKPSKKQIRVDEGTEFQLLFYTYAQGTANSGKSRRLAVELVRGVANAYLFHSALGKDKTEFDLGVRSRLVAGTSHKSELIDALGAPHGEVKYPSILLKNEFGALPEIVPPTNAATALIYNYLEVRRKQRLLQTHLKLLVVFMSDADIIVEVRSFDGVM